MTIMDEDGLYPVYPRPGGGWTYTPPDEVTEEALQARLEWRKRRGFKVCAGCGERKKPAAFGLDSSRPDGLRPYCRACRAT